MPLLACPAVFFRVLFPALLDKPAVAPFFNGLLHAELPVSRLTYLETCYAVESTPMSRLPISLFRVIVLPLCILGTYTTVPVLAADSLKVMTFNIRYDTGLTGPNQATSWNYYLNDDNDRRDRVVGVVNTLTPDILGVQEMLYHQLGYLNGELPGYGYYGVGRATGGTEDGAGERSGIFYRDDRFTATDQGEFWLSDTPEAPGTTFSTIDSIPRMVTWIKLLDQQTGGNYFVMNTHWSHKDTNSDVRYKSGILMREKIGALSCGLPVIAMGDLNETHTDAGYLALLDGSPGEVELTDSYDQTGKPQGKTFHDWAGGTDGSRIDHIFHSSADFQAIDADIVRTTFDGYYPSDHYPVAATLRVVPEPSSFVLCVVAGLFALVLVIWWLANSTKQTPLKGTSRD